jgi:predicted PurR-regulated permease PerM
METVILTLLSVAALGAVTLGVVSVVMNNKLSTRLNNIERWIEALNLEYQRGDEGIYKAIDDVSRKLDSRTDKLQDNFSKEIQEVYRILDERQKSTVEDIRGYLNSWQNSDEFAIMLNKIKKKEFDSDLSKSY